MGLKIIALPIGAVLMFLCNPDGKVTYALTFPFAELITGGIIFLVSWVMEAGRGLREENELTI